MIEQIIDNKAIGSSVSPESSIFKLGYAPQLDGLRAIAVLSVFVAHFIGNNLSYLGALHWGRFGVILFFVLSGFLITTILLQNREKSDETSTMKRTILKNFYIRRFVRIFPVYYLTIAVLFVCGYAPIIQNIPWLLTYTANISMAFGKEYGIAGHLWSLCVEEQFYLIYPAIILFVRKTHIPTILWGMIVLSILYKFVGSVIGISWIGTNWTLPGCFDSLGLGGLLAYYFVNQREHQQALRNLLQACLFVGIPLFVGLQSYKLFFMHGDFEQNTLYKTLIDLSITLPSIWFIALGAEKRRWLVGDILSLSTLRYVGKISYGAYIYHGFVRLLTVGANPVIRVLVYVLLSLAIASLSWQIIEDPINQLKRKAPYLGKSPPVANPPPVPPRLAVGVYEDQAGS